MLLWNWDGSSHFSLPTSTKNIVQSWPELVVEVGWMITYAFPLLALLYQRRTSYISNLALVTSIDIILVEMRHPRCWRTHSHRQITLTPNRTWVNWISNGERGRKRDKIIPGEDSPAGSYLHTAWVACADEGRAALISITQSLYVPGWSIEMRSLIEF